MTNQLSGAKLQAGPGGSQVFVPPANFNLAGDLSLLRGSNMALPSVRPIGAPRIWGPREVKGADGLFWVKLEWDDLRGGFRQYGDMYEVMHTSATNQHVADDKGIARHPFLVTAATTPDVTGGLRRMVHANVFGVMVTSLGAQSLFRETDAATPAIIDVTGFAVPGSNTDITSLRRALVNGTEYLLISYLASGGGANTLQWLSDLSNPPTSGTIAVGTAATYDVIQVPVFGDALLILNGTSVFRASAAATAIGSLSLSAVETVPRAGYWVGLMGTGVGVGTPCVAGVFPLNAGASGQPVQPHVDTIPAIPTNKGKILLFQTSGQLLGELTTKTQWVTNVTKFADGLVYCDQTTHYYWDGRNHIPMLAAQDRFPDSNFQRVCQGHHVKGDKFYWTENYIKTTSGTGNTVQYRMEYDLYTNTSRQVSLPTDLGVTGPRTYGGNNLAISEQNGFLHEYAAGSWYRQYQSPTAIRGYDERKTSGAAAGTGQQYSASAQWISSAVEITGFEAAAKVAASVTGPLYSSLQQGGTGGTTPAYMDVTVTGQETFSWHQQTGQIRNRRLHKRFPLGRNSAFRGPLVVGVVSYQQAGGTDPTRYTQNILPMAVELFMYQPGSPFSATYKDWDKLGDANG